MTTTIDYETFLESKKATVKSVGHRIERDEISATLFEYQRHIVQWAVFKGRCAIWADTGLGKTLMLLEWARLIGGKIIILAPLAVARQSVIMASEKLGIEVRYIRSMAQVDDTCDLYITNYEMVEHIDPSAFHGVVCDESSILKSLDGKTRKLLTEMFAQTVYKLCCTATPAPNDVTELGRHAEFLGVMSNAEMLASFFINDMKMKDGTYRLKRHAVTKFYRWLASWGVAIKRPSDIGYSDEKHILPELSIRTHVMNVEYTPEGMLPGFHAGNLSAIEAKKLRHNLVDDRAQMIANMVNASDRPYIIWCDLNDESETIASLIPDSVNVYGALSPEKKADAIIDFTTGKTRVLVTKGSIAGFGVNLQHCANMIFCGLSYSWESYYQQIRRCWRFGQTQKVEVDIIIASQEQSILDTILRKEKEAVAMSEELINASRKYTQDELNGIVHQDWQYQTAVTETERFTLLLGDSCERIAEIDDNSIDLTVSSLPFLSLYTYSPTERDLGNSKNDGEFFTQMGLIIDGLLRITKPGRNVCMHVQQVALTKGNDGVIGIKDFRGDVIRAFTQPRITKDMTIEQIKAELDRPKFIFHGEVTVDKDPQVQAIRTKTKGLMFVQLNKDSAASRPAFADYLLIFQKPGENAVQIKPECNNDEWIQWAHPVWYDINATDVLNTLAAKGAEDERHICPLQLDLIERCIRLWSNRGETVFDPFAGIGSTGYEAIKRGRYFMGIELKSEYYTQALKNLSSAITTSGQRSLFDLIDETVKTDVERVPYDVTPSKWYGTDDGKYYDADGNEISAESIGEEL